MTAVLTSRDAVIANALAWFDQGALFDVLARRIAIRTESQDPSGSSALMEYLDREMRRSLEPLGFKVTIHENPVPGKPPLLVASRSEAGATRTVLFYGHADVVRGDAEHWAEGLEPYRLISKEGRWYGRGSADNKGQHTINLAAIEQVLAARGRLGLNITWLLEAGEECGSPGLQQFCETHRQELTADVFLASDGPRLNAASATLFLGSRGCCNFELELVARNSANHSGNWGGLLLNPAVRLVHAIATLTDQRGRISVDGLQSPPVPMAVSRALSSITPGEPGGPAVEPAWGDAERTPAERVFASNTLEILALDAGNAKAPVNAIPGRAKAYLQLRFVPGINPDEIVPAVTRHLAQHGFADVVASPSRDVPMPATRLDPDHPFVREIQDSMQRTLGRPPATLPSLGGSLPNACFARTLGLPTVWVPHSYPGCGQHAPNEHLLEALAREGLAVMVGILCDLADGAKP